MDLIHSIHRDPLLIIMPSIHLKGNTTTSERDALKRLLFDSKGYSI